MRVTTTTRALALLFALLAIVACGPGSQAGEQGGATASQGGAAAGEGEAPGGSGGAAEGGGQAGQVSILGAFTGGEEAAFNAVITAFEQQNPGIEVAYTGANDFDALIQARVQAGEAPDIAAFPRHGGAGRLAQVGQLAPLWEEALAIFNENYAPVWLELGSFDGTPYGIFHRVSVKGWIWYNKPAWEAAGWQIPRTWDELMALQAEMKASGTAPWCDGIGAGAATGWKGTDWIENIMLRTQPVELYDRWVAGELPFASPEVTAAFETLGQIWQDPVAVYGGSQMIALTPADQAVQFLFDDPPACWMHMQGSFVTNFLPDEVKHNLDQQVGAFVMPPIDTSVEPPLEVGGDMFVVLREHDRPEVRRFIEFLGTVESTTLWAEQGGALFPHKGQDLDVYPTGIERAMAEAIVNAELARFDGSDNMALEVNQAFWKGITNWVIGNRDLPAILGEIDAADATASGPP